MAKIKLEVALPKKTVPRGGILAVRAMTPKRIRDAFERYPQIKAAAPSCGRDGMVERSLKCTPADPDRFLLADNAIAALEAEWRQVEALLDALEKPFGLDHLDQAHATRLVSLLWSAWTALGLAASQAPDRFPRWALMVLPRLGEMSEFATRREWLAWYESLPSQPIRIEVGPRVEMEVERSFAETLPHLLSPGRKLDPSKLQIAKTAMPKVATLAELVKGYETWEHRKRGSKNIDAANENNTAVFRVLLDVFGADRLVHTIEQGDIEHLADIILALPPRAHDIHKREGKGFAAIATEASAKRDSAKRDREEAPPCGVNGTTLRKYSGALNSLFRFALRRGWTKEWLETKLVSRGKAPKSKRSALSPQQLRQMFHRSYFDATEVPVVNRWIPLVALHQGARMGEIAQMDVLDVYLDNVSSRWILRIAAEGHEEEVVQQVTEADGSTSDVTTMAGKLVKNEHSIRDVPVHPALIEMGFIDFVKSRQEQGYAKLFNARPVPNRNQLRYYDSVRDALTLILKDVEIHKAHVFTPNSMRHTWKACALRKKLLNEHRNALGGWRLGAKPDEDDDEFEENAQEHYGQLEGGVKFAFPIEDLFESLEKVRFNGLFECEPPKEWRPAAYERCSSRDEPKKRLSPEEKAARYELKKKRERTRSRIKRALAKKEAAQAASLAEAIAENGSEAVNGSGV